jgi:hypothetical protein
MHEAFHIEQTAYLRGYSEVRVRYNARGSSYHYDSAGLAVLFLAAVFSLRSAIDKSSHTTGRDFQAHLNPFLNRLDTVLRCRILPVPVVFLRLAFWPHSYERNFALG